MSAVNFPQPVAFPQPEVEVPVYKQPFFYVACGRVSSDTWGADIAPKGFDSELEALARGEIYLTREDAEQRIKWNAQETARLVIPAWFRALGPDVEMRGATGWYKFTVTELTDWSQARPDNFRAKPTPKAAPDVVANVNGVEYRWPATVTEGDPPGHRFIARKDGGLEQWVDSFKFHGPRVHHTRAGAESQLAVVRAALGGGL